MNLLPLIEKKKRGEALCGQEIRGWIQAVAQDAAADDQLAALLMAICWQGMDDEETTALTLEMARSGEQADLKEIPGCCVDKHSTGGVGDTTTLVLTPLVAACGVPVAKMSGRGLGHTGGTVDKLESIPGMRTELSLGDFIAQVRETGCAVIAQSQGMVPADKRLYALRDVTGTIDSLPLIASSIMSKKIAAGCQAIVLDVKTGSGAFMPSLEGSVALAQAMVRIGLLAGRPTMALITDMEQPLGTHIGNALEVKEAIDILQGRTRGRLLEVSLELGAAMLQAAGRSDSIGEAKALLVQALESGAGAAKLKAMIQAQGGNPVVVEDVDLLPQARIRELLWAPRAGFIQRVDALTLGKASLALGAGRARKNDAIDPAVGLVLHKQAGDFVEAGEPLVTLHVNDAAGLGGVGDLVLSGIKISDTAPGDRPLVYARVDENGAIYAPLA